MHQIILGIESSCDETAAAVLVDGVLRSNVIASQEVHAKWGGVVPELASRAHQEHIVPVVREALKEAGITKEALHAVAFTRGPGLIGALLVGTCFARSLAQALNIPLLAVDHVQAHVMAHFIRDGQDRPMPDFPFLNLTVSGGHTQLVLVRSPLDMEVIGTTMDDAAGEAFDKGAKVLGLPYPGGPLVDLHARSGDPARFPLPKPALRGLDFSFSGIKTAFVALVNRGEMKQPGFKEAERNDLCASLQGAIIDHLMAKARRAIRLHEVARIGIAGGVAANSGLRERLQELGQRENVEVFIPPFAYCTDNAAMIAMAGHHLLEAGRLAPLDVVPIARTH
ncbi:MAG: tRNA (adenosine(37)-N6)-threonylcarbamoyltransferase complex transferase subunit TsaD [Flavobacteriales bacterium]|nr:tRNA (adenosine(37)-N6)-threonylcarbamoyltransferase complex transferase subunit TsaD [Flavobacteriales bacterium]MCB0759767.1 tRNA (adenosine(37)-N6)-threonylcarbamoyltransferase complex transferase subunit TsaD [Flavobacteriales bacterium]